MAATQTQSQNIFDWDPEKYTTYVAAMDREHKVLIDLMNQLYQANAQGADKSKLLSIANLLGQKTKEHFASEEKYFSTLKAYASGQTHKKIHETLLTQYGQLVEKFKSSTDKVMDPEFFRFLKVWLAAHICGVDRKYGELTKNPA